jgi:hypothetical protein
MEINYNLFTMLSNNVVVAVEMETSVGYMHCWCHVTMLISKIYCLRTNNEAKNTEV